MLVTHGFVAVDGVNGMQRMRKLDKCAHHIWAQQYRRGASAEVLAQGRRKHSERSGFNGLGSRSIQEMEIYCTRLGQVCVHNDWQSLTVGTVRKPIGGSKPSCKAKLETCIRGVTCVQAEVHNARL